jgi:hypothetical protein
MEIGGSANQQIRPNLARECATEILQWPSYSEKVPTSNEQLKGFERICEAFKAFHGIIGAHQ